MKKKLIKILFAPLTSLFIFTLGSGLFTTLITIRLNLEHMSSFVIGLMTAFFYAGLVLGSFNIEKIITKVGHIRAFSGFASAIAVISILHGIYVSWWFWLILRFLCGYATAGIFIVIESWLLGIGKVKTRGKILSFYMISYYVAQSPSQFLLNIGDTKTLLLFALTAMLSSLSVIPLSMSRVVQPKIHPPSTLSLKKLYRLSGAGLASSFASGMMLSAIYGMLPLFFARSHLSTIEITSLMSITILGGMALQYPIGRFSDLFNRRKILILLSVAVVSISILAIVDFKNLWIASLVLFIFGGVTFTIYPVSISYACDKLKPADITAGSQSLLLVYSIGSIMGPLNASLFMDTMGVRGFFVSFIVVSAVLLVFLLWRSTVVDAVEPEEKFISVPQTTPVVSEMDPRGESG